jgi:alpha-1,3-mannosyltransferase
MQAADMQDIVQGACWGVALQMLLGAPFLLHNAGAYLSRAFELSRVFLHVWSVNLKFLPEPVFQSRGIALLLLALHLALLLLFAHYRWPGIAHIKPQGLSLSLCRRCNHK